jgi:peptidoglycan/xylan/chitin deacetylase (PgdA/CDA1 family)
MQEKKLLRAVTYHFVRDPVGSSFPHLKALPPAAFEEQLLYLIAHHQIVSLEDCMAALREKAPLPPRALLLTFDDAYAEHFRTVLPLLHRHRVKAAFFPPAKAIERHEVLDVNKIHFILARNEKTPELIQEIFTELDRYRASWDLETGESYWRRLAVPFRWDTGETIFIKRLLQRELPHPVRQAITDRLFRRYVTEDEAAFSRELYMNFDELREMARAGMYVGCHGYDHLWLAALNPPEQQTEIDRSLDFLRRIGTPIDRWAIAYPFGSYNHSLLEIVRARGAVLGFTSAPGIGDLTGDELLELPRLDTNDFPRGGAASPKISST